MSHNTSKSISLNTALKGTLTHRAVIQALLQCVLPAEVESVATSLMLCYQVNGLGYEALGPVLEDYLSSPGASIVAVRGCFDCVLCVTDFFFFFFN